MAEKIVLYISKFWLKTSVFATFRNKSEALQLPRLETTCIHILIVHEEGVFFI